MPLLFALSGAALVLAIEILGVQSPRIAIPFWMGLFVAAYFMVGAVATIFDFKRSYQELAHNGQR